MGVRPTQLTDIISWLGIGPQQLAELINAMGALSNYESPSLYRLLAFSPCA